MDDTATSLDTAVVDFLRRDPFCLTSAQKNQEFLRLVNSLTQHHLERCEPYARIVRGVFGEKPALSLDEVPYIPVQLFKTLDLSSVPAADISKTMTSSGTTGQTVSRIVLDRTTSNNQTRALTQIMKSVLGPTRVPMLVIDSSEVIRNRDMFSARGAGIRGFSMFGKDVEYALDGDMKLRREEIKSFVERHKDEPIFLFGFTFMIWEHFCTELLSSGGSISIPNGILVHGGGWKKLVSLNIGNAEFRETIERSAGVRNVLNYYGMVEQTGSIYMECASGHLHCSSYSEVVMRDPRNFAPVPDGTDGVIQVISMLPTSYPGHSLLTEDMGVVVGRDDCSCGRPGTYFLVHGRMKDAEVRGCSDTYAA